MQIIITFEPLILFIMMNIAVVAGGYTDEFVISLRSANFIYEHLDETKYHRYRVHILEEGWFAVIGEKKYPIDKSDFSFEKEGEKVKFDAVYNTIHGTPGEDGHLQAYFELIGMPYSGARHYQSALTFNKRDTLSVLQKFGVNKAESIYVSEGEAIEFDTIMTALGVPFFVKPNQSGSSLGISKVYEESQFQEALETAFKEDKDLIIESELKGDEVSIGVISVDGKAKAIGSTEIISENDYFDYEAKYEGKSKEITPATLSYELNDICLKTAENIYTILKLTGIARLDFIVQNETPYFLEVNTNPGMSAQSIFPQQIEKGGYDFSEILDNEIQLALQMKPIWNRE